MKLKELAIELADSVERMDQLVERIANLRMEIGNAMFPKCQLVIPLSERKAMVLEKGRDGFITIKTMEAVNAN